MAHVTSSRLKHTKHTVCLERTAARHFPLCLLGAAVYIIVHQCGRARRYSDGYGVGCLRSRLFMIKNLKDKNQITIKRPARSLLMTATVT